MTTHQPERLCSQCGAPLSRVGGEELCPGCLLEKGLDETLPGDPSGGFPGTGAAPDTPYTRRFGNYELLEEVARGGMGVVYRAQQAGLDRVVAVKLLLSGPLATPDMVHRFRTEAAAAASLQHPNIVALHEVGFCDGQHFIAMDYVAGRSLAEILRDGPLEARRAAGYVKTVAEAIHFAHERKILHRDLKPSNVLIGADDQPRVTDFGLAKRLDASQLSTLNPQLTLTGEVLGSPSYMAPEQAAGRHGQVGRWTDVYSLGALFYHLLTGRPPFAGTTVPATLHDVLHTEAVSPRLLLPSLPRDLETVCLKCLEKEPGRRYATAQELADELGRFLRLEPVRARPVTLLGRVWRWAKRKPALATLIALVHVVGAVGLAGILWQWQRASRHALEADGRAYAGQMRLALAEYQEGKLGSVRERLKAWLPGPSRRGRPDWRGFEWRWLWGRCAESPGEVIATNRVGFTAIAVSPDGRSVAIGAHDGTIQIVDARTDAARASWPAHPSAIDNIEFIPNHPNWLVTAGGDDRLLKLWDTRDARLIAATNCGFGSPFVHLAVSSNGRLIAAQSAERGGVNVWELVPDPGDAQPQLRLLQRISRSGPSSFLGGGNTLVVANLWGALALHDLESEAVHDLGPKHKEVCQTAAGSPDGRWVATGFAHDDTVWCGPTDEAAGESRTNKLFANASALRFSADSQVLFAATRDQNIQAWALDAPDSSFVLRGHSAGVTALATHGKADERVLYSASWDGTAQRWPAGPNALASATERRAEFEARPAAGGWTFLEWDFEGLPALATSLAQPNREFDTWLAARLSPATKAALEKYQGQASNAPPLRWALLPDFNRLVRGPPIYDPQRFQGIPLRPETQALVSKNPRGTDLERLNRLLLNDAYRQELYNNDQTVGLGLDVSPDQTRLAVSLGREVQIFDLTGNRAPQRLIPDEVLGPRYNGVHAVAFARHTNLLALGGMNGWIALLDGTTLTRVRPPLEVPRSQVTDLAFARDDSILVSGSMWGGFVVRTDVEHWTNYPSFPAAGNLPTERFAVSADGELLVTSSPDHRLKVLKVATLEPVSEYPDRVRYLNAVAFSPTDSFVAFSESSTVFLWDWTNRRPTRRWDGHRAEILGLAFSPDGRTLASGSMDRTVRLWRPGLEQEVAVLTGHSAWCGKVVFAAHGNALASLGLQDASVLVWRAAARDEPNRE